MLVGQGWVAPIDFWSLAPGQVWWVVRAHTQNTREDRSMRAELYQMLKEAQANG